MTTQKVSIQLADTSSGEVISSKSFVGSFMRGLKTPDERVLDAWFESFKRGLIEHGRTLQLTITTNNYERPKELDLF